MGYEQMGDRGPFRFLVAAVSGQSDQREQGHWQRATAHQQQSDHRFKDGGQHLAVKRHLSGSAVPSIQNQVRLGAPVAIKAMAANLARLVYLMLRYWMH